jgi:hypothetical protein
MRTELGYKLLWTKQRIKRWFYKTFHNIDMKGFGGSMLPKLGKGKFVSVYRKKDIIDIVSEENNKFIRLIPYQPNHGLMVEYWVDGRMRWRNHLDLNMLSRNSLYGNIVEENNKYGNITEKNLKDSGWIYSEKCEFQHKPNWYKECEISMEGKDIRYYPHKGKVVYFEGKYTVVARTVDTMDNLNNFYNSLK